ncbi:erg26, C-3 sterol dehydrogenase [Bachmanniomyces sp. S44760]|nr:erg26, C-3 sterol dehydrogenase [Bachmanniomyces sp. S44760]
MTSKKSPRPLGNVLVVGGCGFLGHHIVSQLLEYDSAKVSVIDLRTNVNRLPNVSYHDADVTSEEQIYSVLETEKPNVIIHCASPYGAGDASRDTIFQKVNVQGTKNLFDLAAKIGCVRAFVYTSSASVIHDNVSHLINADERWPVLRRPQQTVYYTESKAIAEEYVLGNNRQHGDLLTTAIRPAAIFGEGDHSLVGPMLIAYGKGQTGFQLGTNDNLYDFTYVGNVAYAHILAAVALLDTHAMSTKPLDHEKVDGEAFFITNDEPVYFWDFPRTLWSQAGGTEKTRDIKDIWIIPSGIGLVLSSIVEWMFWIFTANTKKPNLTRRIFQQVSMTRTFNINKAKRRLGYEPQWNMSQAMDLTMNWAHEHGQVPGTGSGDGKGLEEKKAQ